MYFLVFGTCELGLAVLISAYLITQVVKVKCWNSKALYSIIISSNFLLLSVDLFSAGYWIWLMQDSLGAVDKSSCCDSFKEIVRYVIYFMLALCIVNVLLVWVLGRFSFSSSDIYVSELFDFTGSPPSFRISLVGFISFANSSFFLLSFFSLLFSWFDVNELFTFILWSYSFGTVYLGLLREYYCSHCVSQQFIRSYTFISLTTFPPFMSFLFTILKIVTLF